ncbi:MAG: flagellar protein FlgN [Lachnospiraceae bacterium]|nr:flagellar protein FlgN [Lachnospiraceae bacterium]
MASLVENLISILTEECNEIETVLGLARSKTPVIVAGDLDALGKITEDEQSHADRLQNLDNTRSKVTADIANVINRDVNELKLKTLIGLLDRTPAEQKALSEVYDRLTAVTHELARVNEQNSELLKSSLELVDFELNLLNSLKAAPETANYSKGAYTGGTLGVTRGNFDAKQ